VVLVIPENDVGNTWLMGGLKRLQLYSSQAFLDEPLLEHVQELITTLEGLGIQPSPADEEEDGGMWENISDGDDDDDIQMS